MHTLFITGADGFIGSHLTEAALLAGHKVRALTLYNSFGTWGWLENSPHRAHPNLEVVMGDVRDPICVESAMAGCTHVLHLAALIAIPFSYKAPHLYVETNVTGTLNVLEASRRHGVKRVVQVSTSEVYGTAQQVPIPETHPLNAQSPYAATKIGADQMALAYQRSFGVPVVICRPFNTYGPRQSARAVLPTIISQLAAGRRTIKLGATTPTRDLNFVTDTAAGMLTLAFAEGVDGEVFNLSSNFEISVGDMARLAGEVMGVPFELVEDAARLRPAASEVERLWGDNAKMLARTGWRPKYGGLDGFRRGLKETATWFSNPDNLRHYKPDIYNV
jgi:NAD dependent epimerase/dehydratase